jgi:hypothetical protein
MEVGKAMKGEKISEVGVGGEVGVGVEVAAEAGDIDFAHHLFRNYFFSF